MSKCYFRCSCEVAALARHLPDADELEFRFDKPRLAVVRLGKSYRDGQKPTDTASAVCVAETAEETIDEKLPSEIKRAILNNLRDAIMLPTVAVFTWRRGLADAPPNAVQNLRGYWSDDGQSWHEATTERHMIIVWGIPTVRLPSLDVLCKEVVELLGTRTEEPLGHQLFREAWSDRGTRPRSSLVIGVAAAEVGFKKLVGSLVPEVQWLLEEIQTPSLTQMVRKFLPTLPVKCRVLGKSIRPPNVLLNQLDEAIKRRNKLVHAGQPPPKRNELDNMLRAVSDFLWICDVYAGQEWAQHCISAQTLMAWPDQSKPE